jgi:hypothetical protein
MRLLSNWKQLIKKAWSIRLMVLAGILSSVEVLLPFFSDSIPRGWFALFTLLAVTGAFVTRLLAQKGITKE